MIEGVEIKELTTHCDERGYFRELIRSTDEFFEEGFGQWSVSLMHQGTIKAWHIHQLQTDWWYVASGTLKVVLNDRREDSPTRDETMELLMGGAHPARIVKIPPGVAHGCKCISGDASLFYITSRAYDPGDEGRIAHDDPGIGYDWLKPSEIK